VRASTLSLLPPRTCECKSPPEVSSDTQVRREFAALREAYDAGRHGKDGEIVSDRASLVLLDEFIVPGLVSWRADRFRALMVCQCERSIAKRMDALTSIS